MRYLSVMPISSSDAMPLPASTPAGSTSTSTNSTFTRAMLYTAAKLYDDEEATQAEVAKALGTSRATVSRMLSEARRRAYPIEVVPPQEEAHGSLAERLRVKNRTAPRVPVWTSAALRRSRRARSTSWARDSPRATAEALAGAGLMPGDVLLVSSGRTVYEVAQYDLTPIPGVLVAPTVGGNDQPEEWYQTNEITRLISNKIGGRPNYFFAPRFQDPILYPTLTKDPAIQRVLGLWPQARAILMGIGASTSTARRHSAVRPDNVVIASRSRGRHLLSILRSRRQHRRLPR